MKKWKSALICLAAASLLFFYAIKNDGGSDWGIYVMLDEVVADVRLIAQNDANGVFKKKIGKVEFSGKYYLNKDRLVVVVEGPDLTVWIFDEIRNGGNCYLAHGKGSIRRFDKKLCKNG